MRAPKLLALVASMTAGGWAAEVPLPIAIRDAHIVTVSGADLPKGTVVLRNGLIEAIGANIPVPADAAAIDGTGLTVYPGFIDGLSTWGIPASAPASGSGTAGSLVSGNNATQTGIHCVRRQILRSVRWEFR